MVFNQVCLLLPVAKKMADSVVGVLKNIAEISNTNIIKNANVLLSRGWMGPSNTVRVYLKISLRCFIESYTRLFSGWDLVDDCDLPVAD